MRGHWLLLPLLLVACGGDDGGKKKNRGGDTGNPTLAPPAACPVGDLLIGQPQIDAHLALVDDWNDLRTSNTACSDGTPNEPTNALAVDEALMWTARCWALDASLNGPPAQPDQFSDGTPLAEVAVDQGYTGILTGWALQGGLQTTEQALDEWLAGDPAPCARLWDDANVGAMASSQAGDALVVVRLSGI